MRTPLLAALLLCTTAVAGVALAQTDAKPVAEGPAIEQSLVGEPMPDAAPTPDARTLASDQEVGEARRAYRNACNQYESPGFCDCVTAGVAQVLMPAEVRIAARTIGERITAEGDAAYVGESDRPPQGASSAERIEHVEGYYADSCTQFRR